MNAIMTQGTLKQENVAFHATGGRSEENRCFGFRPAFRDTQTDAVYLSRFADGSPAPFHLLDGLPDDVVLSRNDCGRVLAVKSSVVSGFVLDGDFYSRDEAARKAAELN